MIQLALIHPQPLYCQGIAMVLQQYEDLEVVANISYLRELISSHPQAVLDVIVWHIPSHHAVPPGLRVVKENYPLAKVLALADASNSVYSGLLINLGASAVLSANCNPSQLHQAIVNLSKSYAPPPSSNHVQDPQAYAWDKAQISLRELDVLQLICDGCTDQKIGTQLHISKRTVDGHRLNLRKKLQVNNTAMLVRVALEKQLIPARTIKNKL